MHRMFMPLALAAVSAALLVGLDGCKSISVDMAGRPCDQGACPPGYACHPETDTCVPEARPPRSVGGSWTEKACDTVGQLFPCAQDVDDTLEIVPCHEKATTCACELGCRTCQDDLIWSECSPPCVVGEVTTCEHCGDDCTTQVQNATPRCSTSATTNRCTYDGATGCVAGFFDTDGEGRNGCECPETNGGVEICDNVDNNCDGVVDEGLSFCACTAGTPATEVCDGIDNDCNDGVDDGFECTGSEARDCDAGTGAGSGTDACDAGTCTWSGICVTKDITPPSLASDFAATPGDTVVSLSWTFPSDSDLDRCVVRRKLGADPSSHTDGAVVVELDASQLTPGGSGSATDTGLQNLSTYHYAVFCIDRTGNWQDGVDVGNSSTATPRAVAPDLVTDLRATDTDEGASTITFTMPGPSVDECVLMSKETAYPVSHTDGSATTVGGAFTGADEVKSFVDLPLINGVTYYYAVFCVNDKTNDPAWNDTVTVGANADTAQPLHRMPLNPDDLVATDGEDGIVRVTFTGPPPPVDRCDLLMKQGGYPSNHTDGTLVGGPYFGVSGAPQLQVYNGQFPDSTPVTNGTTYYFVVFCNNFTVWNDTVVAGQNADAGVPQAAGVPANPVDLTATDGDDGQTTVNFTTPAGIDQCILMRSDAGYPANHTSGTQVGAAYTAAGSAESAVDSGLVNGTSLYYAVFCDAGGIWNDSVVIGQSAAQVTPLDPMPQNPTDLTASSGDDSQSTINFTMPGAPVDECILTRSESGPPASHTDTIQIGGSFSGAGAAQSRVDSSLVNGTVYYYGVFCRNGTTWNDQSTPGENTAVGAPTAFGVPDNPTDLVASNGDDRGSSISFSLPASAPDECILLRKVGGFPKDHTDSASTVVPNPYVDAGLVNGTTYYYAAFCRSGTMWNDSVIIGRNADTAVPLDPAPANPLDLNAVDGQDARVAISFSTPPPPMAECVLMAKTGEYPVDHGDPDARQIGAAFVTASQFESITDVLLQNGTRHYYAVFCRNGTTWNDVSSAGANADTGLPIGLVSDFDAADAEDSISTLTYTMPVGATACKVVRNETGLPNNNTDGLQLDDGLGNDEQIGGGAQVLVDAELSAGVPLVNGDSYYYAVFCRVDATFRNDTVDEIGPEINADVGAPLDPAPLNPLDLVVAAATGETTVTFTTPVGPFDECLLLRKEGGYPSDHADGLAVLAGGPYSTALSSEILNDTGLTNGVTYYYTVLCRNGTTWNESVIQNENAGIGTPLDAGIPANPTDVTASDGEDGQVTITFTTPAIGGSDECVLLRKTGDYATDHLDVGTTEVGRFTAASNPETVVDPVANGTTYYYAIFCGSGVDWNDALAPGASADTGVPISIVTDFDATDGEDGVTTLSYTMPTGATACKILSKAGSFPTGPTDGSQVAAEQTGGGAKSLQDTAVSNGTPTYYAVFCQAGAGYINSTVDSTTPNISADSGLPVALVNDFNASNGEDGAVTLTYTMPAGAAACKIVRKAGGYPADNIDGTTVGTEQTGGGSQSVPDSGLANGASIYYAVFCRSGLTFLNDTVDSFVPGKSADTGLPIAPVNDFNATDGEDATTTLSFTMPTGATACKVLRHDTAFPLTNTDGTQISVQTGSGPKSVANGGLVNGSSSFYAVFCQAGAGYLNDSVISGMSADVGLGIALVSNFNATDSENSQVTLTFSLPAGATACKLIRKAGSYPLGNMDGTQVGTEITVASPEVDTSVTNGVPSYYVVFCRADASYRNNTVTPGQNADTGQPTACLAATVSFANQSVTCGTHAPGDTLVTLMHLVATSSCPNVLRDLTVDRHPASTLTGAEVTVAYTNTYLYQDSNANGLDGSDTLLVGPLAMSAGSANFDLTALAGGGLTLGSGVPERLIIVADVSVSAGRGLYSPQMTDTFMFTLQDDPGGIKTLAATPLTAGVHSLGASMCSGPAPAAIDFGVGSLPVASVKAKQATVAGWSGGDGDDNVVDVGGDDGVRTTDCDFQTAGSSPSWLVATDNGGSTTFLHVDTGIPLALPVGVCGGPILRVYGSNYSPSTTNCSLNRLADIPEIYVYVYTSATSVDAASQQVIVTGATDNSGPCVNEFTDLDLSGRYNYAVQNNFTTTNLEVRLITEASGNLNQKGNLIISVPEIYVHLP